jgi:hypothetical protein
MAAHVPLIERIRMMIERDEGGVSESFAAPENNVWTFTDTIANQPSSFFQPFLLDHRLLMMEYNALRDQIDASFSRKKRKNNKLIIQQVHAALIVSEILEHIFEREYLNVWQDVEALRQEQALYRQWLATQGYEFTVDYNEKNLNRSNSWVRARKVREITTTSNPLRLFFVRLRRMFILMAVVINDYKHYGQIQSRNIPLHFFST